MILAAHTSVIETLTSIPSFLPSFLPSFFLHSSPGIQSFSNRSLKQVLSVVVDVKWRERKVLMIKEVIIRRGGSSLAELADARSVKNALIFMEMVRWPSS